MVVHALYAKFYSSWVKVNTKNKDTSRTVCRGLAQVLAKQAKDFTVESMEVFVLAESSGTSTNTLTSTRCAKL